MNESTGTAIRRAHRPVEIERIESDDARGPHRESTRPGTRGANHRCGGIKANASRLGNHQTNPDHASHPKGHGTRPIPRHGCNKPNSLQASYRPPVRGAPAIRALISTG